MSELVDKLSEGSHPVEVSLRPEKSAAVLKECVDREYVHIRFTDTRGGTELGVRLNMTLSDLSKADFAKGEGESRFVGDLTLDYVRVRCVADIDLKSFSGKGHLEVLRARGRFNSIDRPRSNLL